MPQITLKNEKHYTKKEGNYFDIVGKLTGDFIILQAIGAAFLLVADSKGVYIIHISYKSY